MPQWLAVMIALTLDGLAGLTGALLSDRWVGRHTTALISFAAGALIAAALLDALPEAVDVLGTSATAWALGGFIVAAALEGALGGHHHAEDAHEHAHTRDDAHGRGHTHVHTLPAVLLASDALHNLGDGAAIAAAFALSPRAGVATALAVIAHEIPQEIGDYALLRRAGWSRARSLVALAAVQLSAVGGAVAVSLAAHATHTLTGYVLAVASGSFLYIGAADLLPEVREAPGRGRVIGFGLGLGAILAAGLLTA